MSRISYVIMILLVVACSYENKVCDFQSEDIELTIYNNVLTDLIENRMHSRYLGGIEDEIFDKYDYNSQDTIKIKNEIAKAQNSIFNEPSKFCTPYLVRVLSAASLGPIICCLPDWRIQYWSYAKLPEILL